MSESIKDKIRKEIYKRIVCGFLLEKALLSKFAQTRSGHNIYGQATEATWKNHYGRFTPEDHDDAAAAHMKMADVVMDQGERDHHMSEALEHISRAKSKKHNEEYVKLMDKFYPDK